jgi:hypothetical protein
MSHPTEWKHRQMIVIPCGEYGPSRFWQRLFTVQHIGWHIDNGFAITTGGAYIQDAHNKVVEDAMKNKEWDRLVFLEYDHEFPFELLEHMSVYEEPIVSGIYVSRNVEQPLPVIYNWRNDRTSIEPLQPYEVAPLLSDRRLHKVNVVPMGCVSIRRDVFENWPEHIPYYAVATSKQPTGGIMGDDVWFCRHAEDQGYDIYVDSGLEVAHYGLVPYNFSVYTAWVAKMKAMGKTKQVEVPA